MGLPINDENLIKLLLSSQISDLIEKELKKGKVQFSSKDNLPYPLCPNIIEELKKIKPQFENTNIQYENVDAITKIWNNLIISSIKCLRFFDSREPFKTDMNKVAIAYGSDDLKKYLEKYNDFESVLYGGSKYYRDHVFHSFRTWLLGIVCILNKWKSGQDLFIGAIKIDGEKEESIFNGQINFFEKISMWTIIALCHDLGYPLEKTKEIFEKTQDMMKEFMYEPKIWNNFDFNGIQNDINKHIVNFMCTKLKSVTKSKKSKEGKEEEYECYYGRKQPKYSFKYSKSLESYKHGILSAIIIYKTLIYFKEADFNLNDDYEYDKEEAKQFYIRREILRAIASHTCSDIYNVNLATFSSLLFICDELQEWGRKSWSDMYEGKEANQTALTINQFSTDCIKVDENIRMDSASNREIINKIKRIYSNQYEKYKIIFRDGQDSTNRKYGFCKKVVITLANNPNNGQARSVIIEYGVGNVEMNQFNVTCQADDILKEIIDLQKELADSIYGGISIQDKRTEKEKLEEEKNILEEQLEELQAKKQEIEQKIKELS